MWRLTGSAYTPARIEHDFGCVAQIRKILVLHLTSKFLVLDYRVKFAVPKPARDVQVRRADARPPFVGDRCLRVNHGPVPLKDANTSFQQRAISRTRKGP